MPHSGAKFYLVKVADFGCTQRVDPASGATVKPFNFIIGTQCYVAPEVLRCRQLGGEEPPRCPQKVDVYSFGVVAYQVLTGATFTDIKEGYSRSGLMRPDTDQRQWRPQRFDFETQDPDLLLLLRLIRRCWASLPESRPTFTEILDEIQPLYIRLFPPN